MMGLLKSLMHDLYDILLLDTGQVKLCWKLIGERNLPPIHPVTGRGHFLHTVQVKFCDRLLKLFRLHPTFIHLVVD